MLVKEQWQPQQPIACSRPESAPLCFRLCVQKEGCSEVDDIGAGRNIIFTLVSGFECLETFSCCPDSHDSPHSSYDPQRVMTPS